MSLAEILLETIAELFGVPVQKKPPPRRRARTTESGEAAPFALPPARERRQVDSAASRSAEASRENAAAPAARLNIFGETGAEEAARRVEMARLAAKGEEARQKRVQPAALPPDFLDKIRRDPAAARAAFVSTEIFGPPLADRIMDR